ncbi:MAG: dTDP-4-dehydrorhamnose 3,5-epimerase family protein, partial [Patescibacteria group bacterium]
VVNTLTARAMIYQKLRLFGGNQYRPLLHVKDAAAAIAQNIETSHTGIFNIHSDNTLISKLAKKVIKHIPGTKTEFVDMKVTDLRNYRVSSKKAITTFGFNPQFKVDQGIEEIKTLLRENRIRDIDSPRYTNEGQLTIKFPHEHPVIIDGGISVDDRGHIVFANNFDVKNIKRFYMISNHRTGFVRAWHAHRKEAKYVMAVSGSALIGVVSIDNWKKPTKNARVDQFILSSQVPKLLYIPPGHANGSMSLSEETKLLYFSTSTLDESQNDDIRYPARYWDIWSIEER